MSDEGEADIYSLSISSSDTLSVEDLPFLEDAHTITADSTLSITTCSTNVYWIPGGLSGKVVQALGPSAVDMVARFTIKKRLTSISSDIDLRLRNKETLAKDEMEHLGEAYHDLVELSSGSYKAKIKSQAIVLRLTILRALILSDYPCFRTYSHTQAFRSIWSDLDNLACGPYDSETRNTACDLKCRLLNKVTDELSGLQTQLRAGDLGIALAGTGIVSVLCHDLAYGTGGYAVQSALDRISCSSWGAAQLKQLDRHGEVVLDAARRLLIDFDNSYSRGMAFRIFGDLAAGYKTGKLAQLLCGPHGIGSLVANFAFLTQPQEHSYHDRYHTGSIRSMETICTALLSACVYGFTQQVVENGLCPYLVTLIEIFVERDRKMPRYFEEHDSEDPDIERNQIAACKLMLKLLHNDEAKSTMLECGATVAMKQFDSSYNRQVSEWYSRFLIGAIRQKLDQRNGQSATFVGLCPPQQNGCFLIEAKRGPCQ